MSRAVAGGGWTALLELLTHFDELDETMQSEILELASLLALPCATSAAPPPPLEVLTRLTTAAIRWPLSARLRAVGPAVAFLGHLLGMVRASADDDDDDDDDDDNDPTTPSAEAERGRLLAEVGGALVRCLKGSDIVGAAEAAAALSEDLEGGAHVGTKASLSEGASAAHDVSDAGSGGAVTAGGLIDPRVLASTLAQLRQRLGVAVERAEGTEDEERLAHALELVEAASEAVACQPP